MVDEEKKTYTTKQAIGALVLVIMLVVGITTVILSPRTTDEQKPVTDLVPAFIENENNSVIEEGLYSVSIEELLSLTPAESRVKEIYQPQRDYGFGVMIDKRTNEIENFPISVVFDRLPDIPEDFWQVKFTSLMSGYRTLDKLSSDYWIQPEFIELCNEESGLCTSSFAKNALRYYKEPNRGIWYREGFGIFPSDVKKVGQIKNKTHTFYVLAHTTWNVETYQGLTLKPKYFGDEEYFDITVTPNTFLLEPSYIIIQPGYRKLIRVDVTISADTPPGEYVIGLDSTNPPDVISSKWVTEYGMKYQTKGLLQADRLPFLLHLEIVQ